MIESLTQNTSAAIQMQSQFATEQAKQKADNAQRNSVMSDAQLDAAAKEFESVYIAQMLKPMFAEIKTDGMFGGGKGEEVFKDLMIQEYGKIISDRGGFGLSDAVKSEMIRIQEELNAQQ